MTNADLVLLLGIKDEPITCVSVKELQGKIQLKDDDIDQSIEKSPDFINWLGDLARSGDIWRIEKMNEFLLERGEIHLMNRFPNQLSADASCTVWQGSFWKFCDDFS